MSSWVRTGALVAALLIIGVFAPVAAEAAPPQNLGPLHAGTPLTFHGGINNKTGLPSVMPPVPGVCVRPCRSYVFATLNSKPFLVSVKDVASSTDNGWDLFVYGPGGGLVGSAFGVGANGQAVEVHQKTPGPYRVDVTFTYAYDAQAKYVGEVRSMDGTDWQPAAPTCGITVAAASGCFNLPMLVSLPPADLHVSGLPPAASTPLGFPIPVDLPTQNSCYVDEILKVSPKPRCLRFTSNVGNVGAGTLDLQIPLTFVPGACHAQQIVRKTNGAGVARPAGDCMFHPAHAHFHYKDLIGFGLYHASGGVVSSRVGTGVKQSFCLADDGYFGFGTAGPNGPRNYVGQPGCNVPKSVKGASPMIDEGITPGWADVYTWDTPGQYLDITGVASGTYAIVERTNPAGTILVAGPQQTCSATFLTLTADAVAMTSTNPSIACPA